MTDLDNGLTPPEGTVFEPEKQGLNIDPIKSPGDEVEVAPPVAEPEPDPKKPKGKGRIRRFFRNLIRWTLSILIIFGIGFLVAVFVLYRPEVESYQNQIEQANSELSAVQAQLSEMQADYENQIADLKGQIDDLTPLAVDNENLLATQSSYRLEIAILDARLDVANAQLALMSDDTARVRVVLTKTADTLATIGELLPEKQKEVATAMEQRLMLILDELEDDPFAAQSDLDVLEKALFELGDALFSE